MQSLRLTKAYITATEFGILFMLLVISQAIRRLYLLIRDRKYTKNINNSSQIQYKSYPIHPKT